MHVFTAVQGIFKVIRMVTKPYDLLRWLLWRRTTANSCGNLAFKNKRKYLKSLIQFYWLWRSLPKFCGQSKSQNFLTISNISWSNLKIRKLTCCIWNTFSVHNVQNCLFFRYCRNAEWKTCCFHLFISTWLMAL